MRSLLLAAPAASAQVTFGVRAGVAHVEYNKGGFYRDGVARTTTALSVHAEVPVRWGLAVRPEVGLTAEGGAVRAGTETFTSEGGTTRTFAFGPSTDRVRYAEAAVLVARARAVRGVRLGAYAGPAVAAKLEEWNVDEDADGNRYVQEQDLYAPVRMTGIAGLTLARGAFGLDMRHALGLTPASNPEMILVLGPMKRSRVTTVAVTARIGR